MGYNSKGALEAILFASGEPVDMSRIMAVLGIDGAELEETAAALEKFYTENDSGLRLLRLGEKLQICSDPAYRTVIDRTLEMRRMPVLSDAALEVLAITAYYQPVTRAYVDSVRGVDSGYTLGTLCDRGLIAVTGRLEAPGRPSLYSTTDAFLRVMGIEDISELPPLPDLTSNEGIMKLEESINEIIAKTKNTQTVISDVSGEVQS